jgi:nitrogen-specific signal transduction histidine kinase
LSIVTAIVAAHHGTIEVASAAGETTFRIMLAARAMAGGSCGSENGAAPG